MQSMTPEHPQWAEFYRHLCEMRDAFGEPSPGVECSRTMNDVECALEVFGFTPEAIAASIAFFNSHGAHCDCEVLLRFGTRAMDELIELRKYIRGVEERLALIEQEHGYTPPAPGQSLVQQYLQGSREQP